MFTERDNAKNIHAENVVTSNECDQMPFMDELELKPNLNNDAGIVRKRIEEGRKKMIVESSGCKCFIIYKQGITICQL